MPTLTSPGGNVQLSLPDDWTGIQHVPQTEIVAARSVTDGSRFAATAVVTISEVGSLDLQEWSNLTVVAVGAQCDQLIVLDDAPAVLAGQAARLVVSGYQDAAGHSLTLQQWLAIRQGHGIAVAMTCATEDFPALRQVNEQAAASLRWEAGQ